MNIVAPQFQPIIGWILISVGILMMMLSYFHLKIRNAINIIGVCLFNIAKRINPELVGQNNKQVPINIFTTEEYLKNLHRCVFVSHIDLDYLKLEQENYVEIILHVFNGSNSLLKTCNPTGVIKLNMNYLFDTNEFNAEEYKKYQDKMNNLPTIQFEEQLLQPYEFAFIRLRQYLPIDIKNRFFAFIEKKETFQFDLRSLVLNVRANGKSGIIFRLPIWDGVVVSYAEEVVRFGKVSYGVVNEKSTMKDHTGS